MNSLEQTSKVIGIALLSTIVVVTATAALVLAIDFVLLLFLGLLFGVFLTKTSHLLGNLVPIAYGWNLAIVTSTLILLLIGSIFLFGAKIENRLNRTSKQLDKSAAKLEQWLDQYPIATGAIRKIPFSRQMGLEINPSRRQETSSAEKNDSNSVDTSMDEKENSEKKSKPDQSEQTKTDQEVDALASSDVLRNAAGKVFGILGRLLATTFGLVANVGVVFFLGIFVAVNPPLYRDGFAQLFPQEQRDRVTEVMNLMGESMFNWLKGRFMTMLITGAGTSIALLVLGVPMPITIGVITGLLTFIPNIGGFIALGLAMLMGLSQGPMTVVWVVVLYGVLQLVESNVVTPLIQQHQTSIPPALLLAFQIMMAALTGFLGVMVATPLLAASMVLVKEVWIKDTLESTEQKT